MILWFFGVRGQNAEISEFVIQIEASTVFQGMDESARGVMMEMMNVQVR